MYKLASACVLMMLLSVESSKYDFRSFVWRLYITSFLLSGAALECYDRSEGLSEEEFQGARNARLASCEPDLTSSETMYCGLENLVCLYIKFQSKETSFTNHVM